MKLINLTNIFLLFIVLVMASCATDTTISKVGSNYESKDDNCEITFFKKNKPVNHFEAIGKIESHIRKNIFFGGKAQIEDEGYKELRHKACSLGGDAVIIDDYIDSSASEFTHIHIWATVIKYTK